MPLDTLKCTTITNSREEKLGELAGTIEKQDQSPYRVECALDETQQYLRRDCLEINGVPISSYENPNQLVKKLARSLVTDILPPRISRPRLKECEKSSYCEIYSAR